MTVRTRIGPSPTGDPHIGTAYIALMNYLYSKKNNGQFILRIEDTDQARSSQHSEAAILESLRWLGLEWNEGPDCGGNHGPYRQSERLDIYREHISLLLEKGHAFHCFCTPERLENMRSEQRNNKQNTKYDGCCLALDEKDVKRNLEKKLPYVIRMKVPVDGVCQIKDMLRDPSEISWALVDMQVLFKSDGYPTYHLANVVDDHLMEITHVIRGEEWINSTPKHILLYQYFGWQQPEFCHLPLLRNPDKSKLSKRKNPTGILYFRDMGYLPEALVNFLALFALSISEGEEKRSLELLLEDFDLKNISLGGPVFNIEKLKWLNSRYIRDDYSADKFITALQEWALARKDISELATEIQSRTEVFADVIPLVGFLFSAQIEVTESNLLSKKIDRSLLRQFFYITITRTEKIDSWTISGIEEFLRKNAALLELNFRDLIPSIYVAITGNKQSLPLFRSMHFIGKNLTRERLKNALATIGNPTKKEKKAWDKLS